MHVQVHSASSWMFVNFQAHIELACRLLHGRQEWRNRTGLGSFRESRVSAKMCLFSMLLHVLTFCISFFFCIALLYNSRNYRKHDTVHAVSSGRSSNLICVFVLSKLIVMLIASVFIFLRTRLGVFFVIV